MESNDVTRASVLDRIPGSVRLVVALVLGGVLGAVLYAQFTGDARHHEASSESDKADPAKSPTVVQISAESQRAVGITSEPAVLHSLQNVLSTTGTVTEDPERVAHIRPMARGLVHKIYARLGDRVSAGDPLVELDNAELGLAVGELLNAQAELERSQTDLEVKKKILERSKAMLKAEAIAQSTYDVREAECKNAEAAVAGARSTVEEVRQQIRLYGWTDQDLANLSMKKGGHSIVHSVLRAPFSGVVTAYHVADGEVVEPSTELLAITDMSSVWVLADVFEKDLAQIKPGKTVQVRVDSYPGQLFDGKITHVADVIDPKSRTAKVRCLVLNSGAQLKLEMFATIEIPVAQTSPTLAVPDSSLQQIDGQSVVFVRKSDMEFERRDVQTGISRQGYTEIKSGLNPGEVVVTKGSFVVKSTFLKHLIGEQEG